MLGEMRAQAGHDGLLGAPGGLRHDGDFTSVADVHRAGKFRHQNATRLAGSVDSNFEKWVHAAHAFIIRRAPTCARVWSSSLRKNSKHCHSEARCVPRNLSSALHSNPERFLTPFGMTTKGIFPQPYSGGLPAE